MKCNTLKFFVGMSLLSSLAQAQTAVYTQARYQSTFSQAMGGVSLPLVDETGNSLFNNPAGLGRSDRFKFEILNLNVDANSGVLGDLGLSTLKMTSLGSMSEQLNAHPNQTYSAGISALPAISWQGFGLGFLYQQKVRAYSDGSSIHDQLAKYLVPALGYGVGLARGMIRVGYSLQYVNQTSGVSQEQAASASSFSDNKQSGRGFSHQASLNLTLPIRYLPSFALLARNIGGLHFSSGDLADEKSSYDAAFSFTVRVSGATRTHFYLQYNDLTAQVPMPAVEHLHLGADLDLSQSLALRGGLNGGQPTLGLTYRSEASEINLAWYHERSPFANVAYWDARYALQYKIFLKDLPSRDRESETKGNP